MGVFPLNTIFFGTPCILLSAKQTYKSLVFYNIQKILLMMGTGISKFDAELTKIASNKSFLILRCAKVVLDVQSRDVGGK